MPSRVTRHPTTTHGVLALIRGLLRDHNCRPLPGAALGRNPLCFQLPTRSGELLVRIQSLPTVWVRLLRRIDQAGRGGRSSVPDTLPTVQTRKKRRPCARSQSARMKDARIDRAQTVAPCGPFQLPQPDDVSRVPRDGQQPAIDGTTMRAPRFQSPIPNRRCQAIRAAALGVGSWRLGVDHRSHRSHRCRGPFLQSV
jgi:hypothetical protein